MERSRIVHHQSTAATAASYFCHRALMIIRAVGLIPIEEKEREEVRLRMPNIFIIDKQQKTPLTVSVLTCR